MTKSFAEQYKRDADGYIHFPRDVERRRALFPEEVFQHPAKANMFLIEELVEYLTEPGDTLLDPFAGTGTLMMAALLGRHVILLELEEMFVELLHKAADELYKDAAAAYELPGSYPEGPDPRMGNIIIIPGDCRQLLPLPCDHVIFSPPYANVSAVGNPFTGRSTYGKEQDKFKEGFEAYSGKESSKLNLGLLNPFLFGQTMTKIYKLLAESLRPGGTMTVIIRDMMGSDGRVMLSADCIRGAKKAGLELKEWHKHLRPGSPRTDLAMSRGTEAIRDEDILILRKAE